MKITCNHNPKDINTYKFSVEDLKEWRYPMEYLVEILNKEYDVECAREDLLSLLNIRKDGNNR